MNNISMESPVTSFDSEPISFTLTKETKKQEKKNDNFITAAVIGAVAAYLMLK